MVVLVVGKDESSTTGTPHALVPITGFTCQTAFFPPPRLATPLENDILRTNPLEGF